MIPPASADEGEWVFYPTVFTTATSLRSYTWSHETSDSRNRYSSIEVRDDAAAFIASEGEIRGPYLEMAISDVREIYPELNDQDIARLLLSAT
ncbi:DUF2388 domain-containing protein [Pseudomonas sp. NPDC090202]|uniref:DUF2388 domain-containing protein n=1 Tax=unclassified Pseudomonas TaxID=196821 RepID=UPI0037FDA3F5